MIAALVCFLEGGLDPGRALARRRRAVEDLPVPFEGVGPRHREVERVALSVNVERVAVDLVAEQVAHRGPAKPWAGLGAG